MSGDPVSVKDVYKGATPETQKPWVGLTEEEVEQMLMKAHITLKATNFGVAARVLLRELRLN